MKKILIKLIRGYKKYISPALGNNCRFSPTCSEYMMEALDVHGLGKGLLLSVWRLMRCSPFGKSGYDPVPESGMWKNPNRRLIRESDYRKQQGHKA